MNGALRYFVGLLLVAGMLLQTVGISQAGTTGNISGTVTDGKGSPVSGVLVSATSPTGSAHATTNSAGFYSLTGLNVDTYTVSFQAKGYEPVSIAGINVSADQTQTVSQSIQKSLREIGRVTSRSPGGAYQPTQTTDTYTVTGQQIVTQLGKKDNLSETNLLVSLPGASLDSSGYPVLRGGRENEEGFQYEGIDYTDAFTNQFVNSLALNGVGSAQLTPGPGDASIGNNGTGTINLTAKRGTRPPFGELDLEALAYPFSHQVGMQYGFATPNGRFSNYTSFIGGRAERVYGPYGTDSNQVGRYFSVSKQLNNDLVNNLVYKFGRDNNQALQFFYQNQIFHFDLNRGGIDNLFFKNNDPFILANLRAFTGLTTSQIQSVIGLDPQQTSIAQPLNRNSASYQPNETMKLQYSNNINASTYFTTRVYKVNSTVTFDYPFASNSPFSAFTALQGGNRAGIAADLTKQLNSKHLLQLGGKYEYLHPIFSQPEYMFGFHDVAGVTGSGFEVADFLSPTDPGCVANGGAGYVGAPCGYLYGNYTTGPKAGTPFFPNGVPRLPVANETVLTDRQDFSLYAQDTFSPTDRLKVNLGLRLDAATYRFPSASLFANTVPGASDPTNGVITNIDSAASRPKILEPRLGISYQASKNDAFRFQYGRSVTFPPLAFVDVVTPRSEYARFAGIPSYDATTGLAPGAPGSAATFCGVKFNQPCADYADQLFWEHQMGFNGVPIQPAKPETFSNFDASYSHQFKNSVAMKLTPFYRRGYDAVVQTASVRTNAAGVPQFDANGSPIFNAPVTTNLGINRTTGVEFLLTKEAPYGFSGSLAMTYINEFTNVIPLSSSEDFFPSIPPASLALGNVYRVGFISPFQATLAVQYKTHNGFRVNPIVSYNRGYPYGAGLTTATFINGKPYNVGKTNVTSPTGSTGSSQYVDPQNPGTLFNPNIAATRGSPEGSSAGSYLTTPRFNTNISFEYSSPRNPNATVGVFVTNLFNQTYALPGLNSRYQPVATGIAGPNTGLSTLPILYPNDGFSQFTAARRGNQPYTITQSGAPISFRLYYQLGF